MTTLFMTPLQHHLEVYDDHPWHSGNNPPYIFFFNFKKVLLFTIVECHMHGHVRGTEVTIPN